MSNEYAFRVLTDEDWKDYKENNLLYDNGLKLVSEKDGHYTSKSINSGKAGCRWHRVVIDADIPENSTLTLSFHTSEKKDTKINCESIHWSGRRVFTKARDALIQVKPGKYLTLRINFHREGTDSPVLKQVKIYYPRLSYLRYLPDVYQENRESSEFLERFLSIFESAQYESEEKISSIPLHLDPMAASVEFYRWLASWLSLDLYELLGDRNREFILRAAELYKQKGTVSGIASLVSFLTGDKKVLVKEYMNNVFRSYGMEHYEIDETYVPINGLRCKNYYHTTSHTLDTKNAQLMTKRGGYEDEVHYTIETSQEGRYSPNVIGIFIFLPSEEKLIVDEDQLLKIIRSFLPIFVRAEISFVQEYFEDYTNLILEEYEDRIHEFVENRVMVWGDYRDGVDWNWLCTYSDEHRCPDDECTNNTKYRTPHSKIDKYLTVCKEKKKVWLNL